MNVARDYCIQESIAHARTLPLADSVNYLRGLLILLDGNGADGGPVRAVFHSLTQCDEQIELVSSGQLKLSFPDSVPPKNKR